MFKTGDIITADIKSLPIVKHRAIVVTNELNEPLFYHNTPTQKNKFGGNVICDNLQDFMVGRKIYRIEHTKIKKSDVLQVFEKCKHNKFNLLGFNCYDFVDEIKKLHSKK